MVLRLALASESSMEERDVRSKTEETATSPRRFIHLFWITHRWLCRLSGGRLGLWGPEPGKWARCGSRPSDDGRVGSAR